MNSRRSIDISGIAHPPRRLMTETVILSSDTAGKRWRRSSAEEACRIAAAGRKSVVHVFPCLARTCQRRISESSSCFSSNHARAALHVPDWSAFSRDHNASL